MPNSTAFHTSTTLFLKCFHPPKGRSRPIKQSPSAPQTPSPWQPLICFLCLWICLLWTFHTKRIVRRMHSGGWVLSRTRASGLPELWQVSVPCSLLWLNDTPCVDGPLWACASSTDGRLGRPPLGSVVNGTSVCLPPVLSCFWRRPRIRTAGWQLCLTSKEQPNCFPALTFFYAHRNTYRGPSSSPLGLQSFEYVTGPLQKYTNLLLFR